VLPATLSESYIPFSAQCYAFLPGISAGEQVFTVIIVHILNTRNLCEVPFYVQTLSVSLILLSVKAAAELAAYLRKDRYKL